MNAARVAELFNELDEAEQNILFAPLLAKVEEVFARREVKTREQFADLEYYDARRLICRVLLTSVKDARRGSDEAWQWLQGEHAKELAALVDLPKWPPTRAD